MLQLIMYNTCMQNSIVTIPVEVVSYPSNTKVSTSLRISVSFNLLSFCYYHHNKYNAVNIKQPLDSSLIAHPRNPILNLQTE